MAITPVMLSLLAVCIMLGIGFYGLLTTRNLIRLIIMMQVLVKAAVLALVTAGRMSYQINVGQNIAITVIVVDTIVAVVALAFAIQMRRQKGSLDTHDLATLKG